MIKKILKKLAKYLQSEIIENSKSTLQENDNYIKACEPKRCHSGLYNPNEYDQEISIKFKKLVIDIINICNEVEGVYVNIRDDDTYININIDELDKIKIKPNNQHYNEYCQITIIKNVGFRMESHNNISTAYIDENIFDDLFPIVKNYIKIKNDKNFEEIYSKCTQNTIIMRNNNLNLLLNNNDK